MGKTEAKNLDLKSKLSIVSSTIANVKKETESFKNEFNDFLVKLNNDILMKKKMNIMLILKIRPPLVIMIH